MFASIHSAVPQDMRTWASPGSSFHHLLEPSMGRSPRIVGSAIVTNTTTSTASRRNRPHSEAAGSRTFLQQLTADEEAMRARKLNVRRFGSTWLRPVGVSKTLQVMQDEEAEKADAAEQERRTRVLAEETAAAEAAARRGTDGLGGERPEDFNIREAGQDEGEAGEIERDLDEDVPDAGEAIYEDEDAEISGMNPDDEGVDLDEDIPEAGSYQHTDTELDDATDGENEVEQSWVANTSAERSRTVQLRREMTASPQTENESLDSSSPVTRREPQRDRGGPRLRSSG